MICAQLNGLDFTLYSTKMHPFFVLVGDHSLLLNNLHLLGYFIQSLYLSPYTLLKHQLLTDLFTRFWATVFKRHL